MKKFLFLFLVAILGAACGFQSPPPTYSQNIPNQHILLNSFNSTVALVKYDSNGVAEVTCSGVFISNDMILTAAHCVRQVSIHTLPFGRIIVPSQESPVGLSQEIVTYQDYLRHNLRNHISFEIIAYDSTKDLALLVLNDERVSRLDHIYIPRLGESPELGIPLYSVGHPMQIKWNVTSGYVSSRTRLEEGTFRLYSNIPVFYGNSGGPIFDMDGNIVGITSQMISAPHLNRAVHVLSIKHFLRENRIRNIRGMS